MTDTPQTLTSALSNQARPTLTPPTDRDQAIMGWKARRGQKVRELAESAQLRAALRTGRIVRGGDWTVTLPEDLSTSAAMAAKTGALLDDQGRETLTTTLPGDITADPEAGGRYSPALLTGAIRQAVGAATRAARIPGLSRDEREDLAATLAVEVWTLAADRLAASDLDAGRRDRLPKFGDLAGCLAPPRPTWQPTRGRAILAYVTAVQTWGDQGGDPDRTMTRQDRRAADQGWMRRIAANLIAQGADGRGDWRTVATPLGWASLDALRESMTGEGEGGTDPLDGATPLADALRAAPDLAADTPAERDTYLRAEREANRRTGARPGHPATATLRAATAPLGTGPARAILAALTDQTATAGDYLAADCRPAHKEARKTWRRSARDAAPNLAALADRYPVGVRAYLAGLAALAEDSPTGRPMAERPGLSMTSAARAYGAARRAGGVAPPAHLRKTHTPPDTPPDGPWRPTRATRVLAAIDAATAQAARTLAPDERGPMAYAARPLPTVRARRDHRDATANGGPTD